MYNQHIMEFLSNCGWDAFDEYTKEQRHGLFRMKHPVLLDEMAKLNSHELSLLADTLEVMRNPHSVRRIENLG